MTKRNMSCADCKHFNRKTWNSCDAFPFVIPIDIVMGLVGHVDPYKGDRGIQFELLDIKKDPRLKGVK